MRLDELIVGKWYSNEGWSLDSFAKFKSYDFKGFYFSESVFNNYIHRDDYWSHYGDTYEEVSLEKLIEFLPIDHPDITTKEIINEDYSYLNELLIKLNIN